MRISDWSSDVCSSDLTLDLVAEEIEPQRLFLARREKVYDPAAHSELARVGHCFHTHIAVGLQQLGQFIDRNAFAGGEGRHQLTDTEGSHGPLRDGIDGGEHQLRLLAFLRSEEHTSALQSLMRISYAVFCLKKKTHKTKNTH